MQDIIRDNRIVSDVSFANRLRSFLKTAGTDDVLREKERQYLLGVAQRLVEHQMKRPANEHEREYLRMMEKINEKEQNNL